MLNANTILAVLAVPGPDNVFCALKRPCPHDDQGANSFPLFSAPFQHCVQVMLHLKLWIQLQASCSGFEGWRAACNLTHKFENNFVRVDSQEWWSFLRERKKSSWNMDWNLLRLTPWFLRLRPSTPSVGFNTFWQDSSQVGCNSRCQQYSTIQFDSQKHARI